MASFHIAGIRHPGAGGTGAADVKAYLLEKGTDPLFKTKSEAAAEEYRSKHLELQIAEGDVTIADTQYKNRSNVHSLRTSKTVAQREEFRE